MPKNNTETLKAITEILEGFNRQFGLVEEILSQMLDRSENLESKVKDLESVVAELERENAVLKFLIGI